VSGRGREVPLAPGDGVLISSDDVMVCDRLSYGESLSLRVPRPILSSIMAGVDDAVMRPISGQSETLKLLTCYAATLIDENALATPYLRNLAVNHVHDLIALALGRTRDVGGAANTEGLRAARCTQRRFTLSKNSSRHDLSVGVIAAHLAVTHAIFNGCLRPTAPHFPPSCSLNV